MYVPVKSVKALEGYKLQIKFRNGEEKIFDLSPYLTIGKFAELKDISLFNSVTVKFDSIESAIHGKGGKAVKAGSYGGGAKYFS